MKFNKQICILVFILVSLAFHLSEEALNKRSPQENVNEAPLINESPARHDSLVFHPKRIMKKRPQPINPIVEESQMSTEAQPTENINTSPSSVEEEAAPYEAPIYNLLEYYKKKSTLDCRQLAPGFYTSMETDCKMWHMCDNKMRWDFMCPNLTLYSQQNRVCMNEGEVDCSKSADYYYLNDELYKPVTRRRKVKKTTRPIIQPATQE